METTLQHDVKLGQSFKVTTGSKLKSLFSGTNGLLITPLFVLLILVHIALHLPWVTLPYSLQINDYENANDDGAVEVVTVHIDVKIGLLKCLGGICGEDKETLESMISGSSSSSLSNYEASSSTDHFFDSIASCVATIYFIDDASDNLRYDPQVSPYFRTGVMVVFFISLACLSAFLSLITHLLYKRHMASSRLCGGIYWVDAVHLLNFITCILFFSSSLMYFFLTTVHLLLVEGGWFSVGSYFTLLFSIALLIVDKRATRSYLDESIDMEGHLSGGSWYEDMGDAK
mmetsp:Transcript_9125/g.11243  ORF Transcript_9125/g.11243 Transcript_9125/m.11243 type:complete len:287 (+) Transcript_9125:68-928(+)